MRCALVIAIAAAGCKASPAMAPGTAAVDSTSSPSPQADFLSLIDRPRVALDPVVTTMPSPGAGLIEQHFTYATEAGQTVPGLLVEPAGATSKLPVVIALHGTGGAKEDELPVLQLLAARGVIGVAIDARYQGERAVGAPTIGTLTAYETAILTAWRQDPAPHEHPFFYDTVWDVMRLIDYLETRSDVDASHVGAYGVSMGGIETYLLAAVEPRIGVAVPCIGVESFRWALDNDAWQARIATIQGAFDEAALEAGVATPDATFVQAFYDRVVPGIAGEFDGPSFVPLIAPRPLLVVTGDMDDHTPLPGVELCASAARAAYDRDDEDARFVLRIETDTGHTVTPASQSAAIDWFVTQLAP